MSRLRAPRGSSRATVKLYNNFNKTVNAVHPETIDNKVVGYSGNLTDIKIAKDSNSQYSVNVKTDNGWLQVNDNTKYAEAPIVKQFDYNNVNAGSMSLLTIPVNYMLKTIEIIPITTFDGNAKMAISDGTTIMDATLSILALAEPFIQPVGKEYASGGGLSATFTGSPTQGRAKILIELMKL